MPENRHDTRNSPFTPEAHAAFKSKASVRMWWAAAATLVLLLLLVLLGPDQQDVKRRFEYYGAPGELRIMPEISIEDGSDRVHQLPKSLSVPPPPAEIEIEKDKPDPEGTEPAPREEESNPSEVDEPAVTPDPDAEIAARDQVELSLPTQSNPDWYILHQVRPEYPLDVREEERRTPIIFVKAAIFVGPDGSVLERMIQATNGSRPFAEEVLAALEQWKFGWRVDPGAGRWIEMTWNFKSPYYLGGRSLLPSGANP
ncbi:hypothetical protein KJ682_15735 [bacterium]|nr:hypothetical protein [bacterium]